MAETTRPRNVDGQIVCPPGYTLKPDGMCHAESDGVIEQVETVLDAAAETVVREVKKIEEGAETLGKKIVSAAEMVEGKIASALGIKTEPPKTATTKGADKDQSNAGSDDAHA